MAPKYPAIPLSFFLQISWAVLARKRRSYRRDARYLARNLNLEITGQENIPPSGPAVLVMNHYQRPGFQALWFSLAISSVVHQEVHWTMTSAWTDDGTPGAKLRAIISPHILPRLAQVYGFTSMPPMPPRPHEVGERFKAVRHLLKIANQHPRPILALAPEGQDSPDGKLMRPHSGVGRLFALLSQAGYWFHPVGVYETETSLVLAFGPPFRMYPRNNNSNTLDQYCADQVMQAIARLLPEELRGIYG